MHVVNCGEFLLWALPPIPIGNYNPNANIYATVRSGLFDTSEATFQDPQCLNVYTTLEATSPTGQPADATDPRLTNALRALTNGPGDHDDSQNLGWVRFVGAAGTVL